MTKLKAIIKKIEEEATWFYAVLTLILSILTFSASAAFWCSDSPILGTISSIVLILFLILSVIILKPLLKEEDE